MKNWVLLMAWIWALTPYQTLALGSNAPLIRKPAVAGQFYAGQADVLKAGIQAFMADAMPARQERPLIIISPHAGYIYSGQIAADAFNQAARHQYELVVILGTNHTTPNYHRISIYQGRGFETPLGVAEIDRETAEALVAASELIEFKNEIHLREHSIEVQVPFIQVLFPGAKILPAVVGALNSDLCQQFAALLVAQLKGKQALIVASTDLSHYPDHEKATAMDHDTLAAICRNDPPALLAMFQATTAHIPGLSTRACGSAPTLTAAFASKLLNAECVRLISYANSGDTAIGDRQRVVGYGAAAYFPGNPCPDKQIKTRNPDISSSAGDGFTRDQQKALLAFARKSIWQYSATRTAPLARNFDPALNALQGAFVTLNKNGQLRGCIGHMAQDLPLSQVVGKMALQSALNDRRFSPVTLAELDDIDIEISALTPFREVKGAEQIRVGVDGVIIEKAGRSAVFLPQVAVEQGWNRETMLSQLCLKAGLDANAWKSNMKFSTFQAIIFSEAEAH